MTGRTSHAAGVLAGIIGALVELFYPSAIFGALGWLFVAWMWWASLHWRLTAYRKGRKDSSLFTMATLMRKEGEQ